LTKFYRYFVVVTLVVMGGCANHQYKNPDDQAAVLLLGTFETRESYVDFLKGLSPLSDALGNGGLETPIAVVAEINGLNVGDNQVPTYILPGRNNVKVGVSDRLRIAYVDFDLLVKPNTTYKISYRLSSVENTELVEVWIKNHNSGEIVTEAKTAAMLPISKDPVIVPIIL
jgi:hypothetical protein